MKNLLKHRLYRSQKSIISEGIVTVIVTIVLLVGACVCAMADPIPGPNINVSNLGDSQSEVGIAVNPTNPLNLIAVANDIGDLTKLTTWYSLDGGTIWNVIFLDEVQDGFAAGDIRFDPNVTFDSDGNAYVVYSINGTGINALLVAKSTDGGVTYTQVTTVTTDVNNANNLHTAMVTTRSDPGDDNDDVLVVWARPQAGGESIEAALSLDAGGTFPTQNNNINDALQRTFLPWASVNGSGDFEVVWEVNQGGTGTGVILHDTLDGTTLADNATNNTVTTVQITDFAAATSVIPAQPDRGIFSVATVEVNRSTGRIYVTYTDRLNTGTNDTDIYFRTSDDNGANWSARLQINDDTTTTSQFMPRMAVDHTTGVIYAIWYDARNDVTNNQQVDIYVSQSCDNGANWTPNVQVTTARSDESTANPARRAQNYLEYIGLTANAGLAHVAWTDARAANFTAGTNEDTYTAIIESAPVITCPSDVTIECDEFTDPSNTGVATATDNCDSDPSDIDFSDAVAIICGQAGTITRTWTATDSFGNSSSCDQIITVVDTTDPVITCPSDVTIECDESTDPSNTGEATATDNCGTPDITFSDVVTPGVCPQEETITRTWTATDPCGNSSSCDQIINVVDTTAPVISCGAPGTIIPPDAPISFTATATDNCSDPGDITVEIIGFDCFKFTKKGKRIDKTESCAVQIDGDTITILDSGGVGDRIEWTVRATDECGNFSETTCEVLVVKP